MPSCDTTNEWLKWSGFACQMLGLLVTLWGVGTVQARIKKAAADSKRSLGRWLTDLRERVRTRWHRLRRKPVPAYINASDSIATSDAVANLTIYRHRVDRASTSSRHWLAHL